MVPARVWFSERTERLLQVRCRMSDVSGDQDSGLGKRGTTGRVNGGGFLAWVNEIVLATINC